MKRPKTKKKAGKIVGWIPMSTFGLRAERADLLLVVMVSSAEEGKWIALAVVTPGKTSAAVLANHGHRSVGKFSTPHEAAIYAERFAADWIKGMPIERCRCKDTEG